MTSVKENKRRTKFYLTPHLYVYIIYTYMTFWNQFVMGKYANKSSLIINT